ncbi:hypothetical protein REPUB_Repub12eG0185800 [Reevesia pubescens]
MRYVNYAKAAKLSIYSPDFRPHDPPLKAKKKASMPDLEQTERSSDSEDSIFELPSIASLEFIEVASPAESASGKMKPEKNWAANEGCSSKKGKANKQK